MPLPKPPVEVPRQSAIAVLAPRFKLAVEEILADMAEAGYRCRVFETVRTPERQAYLYGFGRDYDDGRGPVTKAKDALSSWHAYGLAVDIVEDDATPWTAPQAFWQSLGATAEAHGCTWGGRWPMIDLPHVQWGLCPKSPVSTHRALYNSEGMRSVWDLVDAL